jgi:trk system potassium uptake protein TrkH
LLQPHSISEVRRGGRPVDTRLQLSLAGFFCLFIMTWIALAFALTMTGVDLSTSFYSTAASLVNMPLLIGSTIDMPGYAGTFSDSALGVLTFAMLAGRLEIILLLAVLMPRFWSR